MANPSDITTFTPLQPWDPERFEALQTSGALELRAGWGSRRETIMRLMANRDVQIYGELLLNDGGLRAKATVGLTCTLAETDVVSFRSGNNEGEEVLRVLHDGTLASAYETALKLKSYMTADFIASSSALQFDTDLAVTESYTLLEIKDAGTSAYTFSGYESSTSGSPMTLRSYGRSGLKIQSQDPLSALRALTLEGSSLEIKVDNSGAISWGTFSYTSSRRRLQSASDLDIQVLGTSTTLRFLDKDGNYRAQIDQNAAMSLVAPSGSGATLTLDSTATASTGKSCSLVSNHSTSELDLKITSTTVLSAGLSTGIKAQVAILFQEGGGVNDQSLSGNRTLGIDDAMFQRLNPNGSNRIVNLPAEENNAGLAYRILNSGSGYTLTIKDDGGATKADLIGSETAWFVCNGSAWFLMGIETIDLTW